MEGSSYPLHHLHFTSLQDISFLHNFHQAVYFFVPLRKLDRKFFWCLPSPMLKNKMLHIMHTPYYDTSDRVMFAVSCFGSLRISGELPTYPSPNPKCFYSLSLRAKCWGRGGVGREFPRNVLSHTLSPPPPDKHA